MRVRTLLSSSYPIWVSVALHVPWMICIKFCHPWYVELRFFLSLSFNIQCYLDAEMCNVFDCWLPCNAEWQCESIVLTRNSHSGTNCRWWVWSWRGPQQWPINHVPVQQWVRPRSKSSHSVYDPICSTINQSMWSGKIIIIVSWLLQKDL